MSTRSDVRNAAKEGKVSRFIECADRAQNSREWLDVTPEDLAKITGAAIVQDSIGFRGSSAGKDLNGLWKIADRGPARLKPSFHAAVRAGMQQKSGNDYSLRREMWGSFFHEIRVGIRQDKAFRDAVSIPSVMEALVRPETKKSGPRPESMYAAAQIVTVVGDIPEVQAAVGPDLTRKLVDWYLGQVDQEALRIAPVVETLRRHPDHERVILEAEERAGRHLAARQFTEELAYTGLKTDYVLVADFNKSSGQVTLNRVEVDRLLLRDARFALESWEVQLIGGRTEKANEVYKLMEREQGIERPEWVPKIAWGVIEKLVA